MAATTRIHGEGLKDNPQVQRRIDDASRALLRGDDFWSRRFDSVVPEAEKLEWEKRAGSLVGLTHTVALTDTGDLKQVFAGAAGALAIESKDGWQELTLRPSPGNEATAAQRREFDSALQTWSETAAVYFQRCGALYRYLDGHPDRAEPCLASVLKDVMSPEALERAGRPTGEEADLLDPLGRAMNALLEIFATPDSDARSLNELSHLVHDPFPSKLTVRVPGAVLELEGFIAGADGALTAPDADLYTGFKSLEGQWVSPDPFIAYVDQLRRPEGSPPFDLEAFLRQPRRWSAAPSPSEVLEALRAAIGPAPLYRVRWSRAGPNEAPPTDLWGDPLSTQGR